MSKNNIILDLDNTIISCISITDKKAKLIPDLIKKFPTHYILSEHNIPKYYIFPRFNLQPFLDYIFTNFNVIVWTSASRRYCSFVLENLLNNRPIQYIFFDYHVNISNKLFHHPKHLDLLSKTFNIPNITYDNTIIIDNNQIIANNSLPYKTYCCKHFNIVSCINSFTNDKELQNIINHLSKTFSTPQSTITNPTPTPVNNPNIYPNPANPNREIKKEVVKQADFVKQNMKQEIDKIESKLEPKSVQVQPKPEPKPVQVQPKPQQDNRPKYEILGWKKVESRSRPGQFSYENIHTGERIQDVPKYEASKIPDKSKDLEEYE